MSEKRRLIRNAPSQRTRGSTFRRAGTRMLVLVDGSVVCELSGGCPQRDIVQRALEVAASGVPRLVSYNAESGLDVLIEMDRGGEIEMGCCGELDVLIEPLLAPKAMNFVDALADRMAQRCSARMATLFAVDGAAVLPRRLLWRDDEMLYDGIGDNALTQPILDAAASNDTTRPLPLRLSSTRGEIEVPLEPVSPPHALVVIGDSAAARALLPVADALGWRTTLVDHDPARLQLTELPDGVHAVCAAPDRTGFTVRCRSTRFAGRQRGLPARTRRSTPP